MSAQNLLLLVVASVIAIGGLWYYFDSSKKEVVGLRDTVSKFDGRAAAEAARRE